MGAPPKKGITAYTIGEESVPSLDTILEEADGHSLSYHTADGRLSGTGTMKELEAALADSWFFRCGKGVLVNLEHVSAIVEGDAVVHGETVQVSRARRKEFLAAFNRYINEVGQ